MPGARWFPGARLNYAEHILRMERPGEPALLYLSETAPLRELPWEEFTRQVRVFATWLRGRGVRPGDRVAAYLPNVPEAMVAMVATASIGAVWASVSPDFGVRGALDRFGQLAPAVLIATDGYRYGGRDFDRRGEVTELVPGLPGLREVVDVPGLGLETTRARRGPTSSPAPTSRPRSSPASRCPSTTRCGCCSPPAPPACPRRSCTGTAASCSSS